MKRHSSSLRSSRRPEGSRYRSVVVGLLASTFAACSEGPIAAGSTPEEAPTLATARQALAAAFSVTPITWNIIGMDSNNVAVGPNSYPVGVRVSNTGDATATDVTVTFAFTTANALINLSGPSTITLPSLAAGASADVYFNAVITRNAAAYGTSRRFSITVSAPGIPPVTTPIPRELYVERLVSQGRNQILSITGPTTVNVGDIATYVLDASTAPGGYEQLTTLLDFPNIIFEVISTTATYTAPAGATNDKIYADACGWNNDPTSPTYRSCVGPEQYPGGKAGGTIRLTYVVRIIGGGTTQITGLIYDFSGASFHYNSDFGLDVLSIRANSAPTANNDAYTTPQGTPLTVAAPGVLTNDTDAQGDPLTAQLVTGPTNGTLTLNADGSFTYTPNPGFTGTDSFTYTASDGTNTSAPATVTVDVLAGNAPPTANNDTVTVAEDSGATVVDVLANDSTAPDAGETLTVTAVTQPAAGGTVVLNGGEVSFTPAPDFNGTATFTYTVSDGNGGTATATVTITVTAVNDPPTGVADTFSVSTGSGPTTLDVLANDSSAPDSGETLTVSAVTQPVSGGTVSIAPGGTGVVFTPTPGFSGPVTFTYTVSDGNGGTTEVTVTINVLAANSPPDAVADAVTVEEDSGATVVDVLANDSTAPDAGETLTVTAVSQPASGGTVTLTDGVVSFTPAPNFFGTTTFSYTVSDGNGGEDTAAVTVTVTPVNDPPTGQPDTFQVVTGTGANTLDVLANDSSAPDTDETLTVSEVTQPASGGTVSVAPGGSGVVFTPAPGFTGPVTFTYTLSDGNGGTATVTVTVNVGQVDTDNDGIPDHIEREIGLDPEDADSDDDGVPDGEDGTTDTDGDGLIDALDPDSDGDGLLDGTERGVTGDTAGPGTDQSSPNFVPDADPSTTTDPHNPDTDGDGLKDGTEDADHNGAVGGRETDPNDADTDDGGLSDGEEVNAGGDPLNYADDLSVAGRGCATTGTGTLLPLLLLLAMPLLRRRQALRAPAKAWGLLGLLAAVLVAAPASAQSAAAASQGIDVQQYKPAPGWRDVLGLHSPEVAKHLGWNLGLSFNYARDPLNFLRPRSDEFIYEIVKNQVTFDLMGSIALYDRFELGVALPITSQSSASAASVTPLLSKGVDATGIGDLRLVPKAHLLSTEGGLRLGVAVPLLLPTSGGKEFLGRSGVAAFPRLLGEWTRDGGMRVLANVGMNLQPSEQFYNLNVGNEFAYGVGAEVPFQVGEHRLAAEATLMGAMGMKETNTEERPLEVLAALRYQITDKLGAHLGGGPGLTRGYGTPGFRVMAGIIWTEAERIVPARIEPPPPPVCPQGPEDVDGFQDDDGCADPDNDGDGLEDARDRCPNEPETKNGFEDEDGCPDELPPPPVDSDGDGLTDDKDRCPQAAEDKDGFQDEDGCPELDNDRDGVADADDKCPTEPETINGVQDEDGCPDKGQEKVKVEGQKIVILDKVYFATNKDVILAKSFPLLKQVGQVLRANPQLTKVRVEGHTDSQGADAFNLDLSQRRANSVRTRLIEQEGIAPERLEAVGYGETRPVDDNKTARGRENNRRVEFIVLEVKEQP